jgi:hypothetical protein
MAAADYEFETIDISVVATTDFRSVGDFLRALGMNQWEHVFLDEDIDLKTLFFLEVSQIP